MINFDLYSDFLFDSHFIEHVVNVEKYFSHVNTIVFFILFTFYCFLRLSNFLKYPYL